MAITTPLSDTTGPWKAYDQWIEVDADKAAYTAASPENALVLIGPNRKPKGQNQDLSLLTPIGLLQNLTIGQNINWQVQQMIGSARTFFLAGKAPGNGSIARLFTSSSTILGAIYKQVTAKNTGLNDSFESKAYDPNSSNANAKDIIFTLDSELLKIPVGMACLFRDTVRNYIGGFYVEHIVFQNLSLGFAVGQPAIMESVQIMFDRVVPFDVFGALDYGSSLESAFDAAASGS